MYIRYLTILVFLILHCHSALSQSIFTFRYQFNKTDDSILYHAFLLRNDDGSGLVRVRFNPGAGKEDVIVENYVEEVTEQDAAGNTDSGILLIRTIQPNFIQAGPERVFNAPVFVFRLNPNSGFMEPASVAPTTEKTPAGYRPEEFTWKLAEGLAVDRKLVGAFFNEDDEFYRNLFQPATRGLSPEEKKTRMHLLIVADTLDKRIGKASTYDIAKVTETFGSICAFLGIRMETTIVYGKNYGKAGVQAALNKLKTATAKSKNDLIVFYYTGHGFQIPERPSRFPNIKLKNYVVPRPELFITEKDSLLWAKKERDVNITNSMNIEEIARTIQAMKTRFSLVISDCCNDDIFSVNIEGAKPAKTKGSGIQWDEKNLRELFFNKLPLTIIATAAVKGQRATCKPDFGGFFTDCLKKSLESHGSRVRANVSWNLVLRQTSIQTTNTVKNEYCSLPKIPANRCNQSPDSEVKIR